VLVAAGVLAGAVAWATTEQTIEPLTPPVEQRVQPLGPGTDQRVEQLGGAEEQQIGPHVPPSPAQKAASNAGKVVLGIAGTALALGAMAASLLFL
jgi:hypothetical protein